MKMLGSNFELAIKRDKINAVRGGKQITESTLTAGFKEILAAYRLGEKIIIENENH